ncbi:hypothetical protein N7491_010717 [Penicillium cf. griseofulvum]|uniref:Uncharacterized protein n=1 Tax=Penicillium cf. griseofulvum TaxID=2972120 RepID=A0A9W9T651_9EURO|nr:hypothetical protein N7472_001041 [Penicillium cf. griseofulvum]KAJ5422272.1 hypothetical protein N7491_010717 [Penicillium cf. griseofulvum]KAJ5428454.1 hypothetical protein N7445_009908 [Penicillium cf. griseofulvum]
MALRERTTTREAGRRWMSQQAAHIQSTLDLIAAGCSFPNLSTARELDEQLDMLLNEVYLLVVDQEEDEAQFSTSFVESRATVRG